MKIVIFVLIFFSVLYGSTNTTNFQDKSAKYLEIGTTFTVPFTGWFFSVESTRRLLTADTEAPLLKAENAQLKAKIAGQEYVIDLYSVQMQTLKTFAEVKDKESRTERFKKPLMFVLGATTGVCMCLLGIWAFSKLQVSTLNDISEAGSYSYGVRF